MFVNMAPLNWISSHHLLYVVVEHWTGQHVTVSLMAHRLVHLGMEPLRHPVEHVRVHQRVALVGLSTLKHVSVVTTGHHTTLWEQQSQTPSIALVLQSLNVPMEHRWLMGVDAEHSLHVSVLRGH